MQINRQQRRAAERAAAKAQNRASKEASATEAIAHEATATSHAQLDANRANALHSTGPKSPEGRAAVSQNRLTHGLSSQFRVLPNEDPAEFQALSDSLHSKHKPVDPTEIRLVDAMAQHFWRMQRAIALQDSLLEQSELDHKAFSLYLRYQTTHERSYYRAARQLATLRKEAHCEQIGFESQKRQQELNDAKIRLTNARAAASEIETEVKATMEAPLPGHTRIPFEDLKAAFSATLRDLNKNLEVSTAK